MAPAGSETCTTESWTKVSHAGVAARQRDKVLPALIKVKALADTRATHWGLPGCQIYDYELSPAQ